MIGQEKNFNSLIQAGRAGRLGHAFLITGPEGIGKFDFALELAKIAICDTGNACNNCSACIETGKLTNLDLAIIGLEENIKIEDVRQLQKILSLKPYKYSKKIAIIKSCETMNKEAANSLLKTLEEPLGEALIILTTNGSYQLLPTIKSRCQEIRLVSMSEKNMIDYLIKNHQLNEIKAVQIAKIAAGRIGLAKELVSSDDYEKAIKAFVDIVGSSMTKRFECAKEIADSEKTMKYLNYWELFLRDFLLSQISAKKIKSQDQNKGNINYSASKTMEVLDNLAKTREYVWGRINTRLVLENLFLSL